MPQQPRTPEPPFTDVPGALAEIKAGRMVVVVDDEDRENEGDLTLAAEHVTPEAINFMARYGRGLICLTLTEERADHLRLFPMTQQNSSRFGTAFTETIEAREGVTTGISAADRARTIRTAIDADGVTISVNSRTERIATHTVLWAAGVRASRLGKVLAERAGAQLDRAGRVIVEPDLSVPGHPEILVIGDLASFIHQDGKPLPGVAPVAMQQGSYVARLIRERLAGREKPAPFRYFNKGNLATIGRNRAVAEFGKLHISGFPAWFTWVFVHLMYLVEFDNRLLVFTEWVYNYFTRNRGARLITGGKP